MRAVSKKRAKLLRERKKLTDSMKREGFVGCGFPCRDWGVEGPIDADCNNLRRPHPGTGSRDAEDGAGNMR